MKDNKSGRSGVSKMPRMCWANGKIHKGLFYAQNCGLLFEVHNLFLAKSIKSLIRKNRASYKQKDTFGSIVKYSTHFKKLKKILTPNEE